MILSCINRRPVVFYLSSAKLGQHILGDFCSRTDTSCQASDCAVERFLDDIPLNTQLVSLSTDTADITTFIFVDSPPCVTAGTAQTTAEWLSGPGSIPIGSTETWKQIQQQDGETSQVIHLITTGDSPRKLSSSTAVNRFFKLAQMQDNLLGVRNYNPRLLRETSKIVVPTAFLHRLEQHTPQEQPSIQAPDAADFQQVPVLFHIRPGQQD